MTETTPPTVETPTFTRRRSITLATLKFVVDKPVFVLITGSLHEGKQRVGRTGQVKLDSNGQPRKPPTLLEVVDMTTGETAQIIAATIIKTELDEAYPHDSYVGLGFSITKQKRKEGREYDPYEIFEVDVPPKFAELAASAKKNFEMEKKKKASDAAAAATTESPVESPAANKKKFV